jgi:hypothetical protein
VSGRKDARAAGGFALPAAADPRGGVQDDVNLVDARLVE